jgi:hypothetical protein
VSLLLGYGWLDRTAYWAWVAGMAMGGFLGMLLGQWMAWLLMRNPLGMLIRAVREAWADVVHLWTTGQLRPGRLARPETPRLPAGRFVVSGAASGADADGWLAATKAHSGAARANR